ncbi:MAG: phage major capsid protein [Gemmataceae bacterium]|jgi:HK97 family phage major capsid protein|nr:phage major capsid protein [Gemmataceae bacterium]
MSPVVSEKFQSREELVSFIEDQAMKAVEKAHNERVQNEKATAEPTRLERRVPWVTSGPVGRDSAGYSILKAAGFALGYLGADQAKEELHVHQQLKDLYQSYGFVPHCGAQSFLIPLSTQHLPTFEPKGAQLREELRQKMLAQTSRYDPEEASWISRRLGFREKALGTGAGTGGEFVPPAVFGEIIDLQRNLEAFANAGAQEVSLPPNGRLQFPKLTGGSTAYWVGEATAITESTPTTANLDLQAKKLGVLVKVNNELLRFSSAAAEGLIRYDMARSAAIKADLAMLEGTGPTQIKGLITYSGINTHTASTVGANGDTFEVQDVALMEGKLPDGISAPSAWLMRKSFYAALMNRRADAVTTADSKGAFLFHPTRNAADAPPTELYGTKVVRSAQISANRTKGSSTNLTYVILGYFPDWIIARMGVMEFLASGLGDSAMVNDQTYLRGIQHIDAGPRNPASFVLCDKLING